MKFGGVWRDYQARVLDEMDDHLADGRLHVVAPPGAGKTILGLEIIARLGRPALVLAPTVTIRDQWARRLYPLFLNAPPADETVSCDLGDPRSFTLVTYQALDAHRRGAGLDALIVGLNAQGPLTLVLDEAHHLRREWWSSLEHLAASLDDPRIIALTGTPPYDAGHAEWARYEALCGSIDVEIGIPALVRNGDLCPHQDHVIFSHPTADALALLDNRRRAIADLQQDLREDGTLLDRLQAHPWLSDPAAHVELILDAPEMLSAVLVLLAAAGRALPKAPLDLLGVSARDMPPSSLFWLERLLDGLTGELAKTFPIGDDRLKQLRARLHHEGLIEGGRVRLRQSRSVFRVMASSLAKLDSITDIARAERASLGTDLRMVILADHIRAEEMPTRPAEGFRPAKLGVVPIFETLRRQGGAPECLGMLTGTLVIVPKAALASIAGERETLKITELPACPDHVRLEAAADGNAALVQLVTGLLSEGRITVLVGTQSLLGEGWDAPTLNSLVLASNTASFMLSNQMRGRALRIDTGRPGKVANIWHLATIVPESDRESPGVFLDWGYLYDRATDGVADAALLQRRFLGFEGISNGGPPLIEGGIGRLGLDLAVGVDAANRRSLAIAMDREGIARRWSAALGEAGAHARTRQTAAPTYAPRQLSRYETLRALVWSGSASSGFALADALRQVGSLHALATVGMGLAGLATVASAPNLARGALLLWRNGSLEGSLAGVGETVLRALDEAGLVSDGEVGAGRFSVRASIDGRKDIILTGVSRATERKVMQAIAEVLGPVQNPRYLLIRTSRFGWRRRVDYHAVPSALGASKQAAERFAALWSKRGGFVQTRPHAHR
jgi:superfamily II DNA or RNA helicase